MRGITFNNMHSYNDLKLHARVVRRPILPEPKLVIEEPSGVDGEYDYSDVNPDGRTKYRSVTHEVELALIEKNPALIRMRVREIARWLACGEQRLIYDDEPAVFYLARVINRLDPEAQLIKLRQLVVQFRCRPFGYSSVESNQQLQRGVGLMRGYGFRRDMAPTVFTVTAPVTLNIYNPGTYVKPLIRVTGSCSSISFTCNGRTVSYNAALAGETLEIDCQKMQAYKGAVNVNNNTSGDYIEFANGNNQLSIGGTGLNCTVTLVYRYLYI